MEKVKGTIKKLPTRKVFYRGSKERQEMAVQTHPKTLRQYQKEIDQAIADLRYTSIGVNIWNAIAFLLPNATWGAYPVNDVTEVTSGLGVVHNTYLLEDTQKTVGYGPFVQSPEPPWFATNKNSRKINKIFAHYSIDEKISRLPGLFYQAFKG